MASVILEEEVNLLNVSYLLDNYTFKEYYSDYDGKKCDAKKEYNKIIKYLNHKLMCKNNYVKYNYAKGRKSGRLYGENTIQRAWTNVRGFICDGLTTDVDMCSAHPTILFTLCLKYDILCPNLKLYIDDRAKCLLDIQEKDNINYFSAKKKVLVSTNLNEKIKTKSDFLKNYDKEMKIIHKNFLDIDDFNYVKQYARKEFNFEGSFINHILCIHENEILSCMRTFCDINNIKIHSVMFDGFMLYGIINEYTLNEIQKYVNENTIFDKIKLSIKPHKYDFELPDNYIPQKRTYYEDTKKTFEEYNCKVGADFICEKHNQTIVFPKIKFNILHEELTYIDSDGNKKKFLDEWFLDDKKRKFDTYDTIPTNCPCPDHVYNMWEKLPVEIMPSIEENEKVEKALQWFLNHIKVLTDYNEIHSEFVIMWLAQMFQYPLNKSMQLVFVGEEGAGKGTFIKFLTTIMGGSHRCFVTANPQVDVFDKFNDDMIKAYLVVFDEADKSGIYNNNSKFKNLITEPSINIKPKGHTAYTMRSVHRFMSFSNNPDPSIKNKRRDLTIKMSSDKIDNEEYFTEGNLYAKDIECCKFIYDYLMKLKNIKPFIVKKDIPVCEYDNMLKETQLDDMNKFIEDLIYNNYDLSDKKNYISKELYELYIQFCKDEYIEYRKTYGQFTTKLYYKNFNGIVKNDKKINKQRVSVYNFDFQLLKKTFNLINDEDEGEGEDP